MITLLNTGVATLGVVPEIPQDCDMYRLYETASRSYIKYLEEDVGGSNGDPLFKEVTLPPGNWIILGWSDEITEYQCHYLLQSYGDIYLDYLNEKFTFKNGKDSFNSWLLSNGITERKLILKQVI